MARAHAENSEQHPLSSPRRMEDATQLKGRFVGLLDALERECAADEHLADAVVQVVSSHAWPAKKPFITHVKSAFADFTIAEIGGGAEGMAPKRAALEDAIGKMESFLHALTGIKARATFAANWWSSDDIAKWLRRFKAVQDKFYASDDMGTWQWKEEFKTVLALFITPLVATNPTLASDVWANKARAAAAVPVAATPAKPAGARPAKRLRTDDGVNQ